LRLTLFGVVLLSFLISSIAHAGDVAANPWFRAGRAAVSTAAAEAGGVKPAKNVILFIGDGMGIATVTAARIREGQLRGETGEENQLAFERLPFTAFAKTYNTDFQVPDSAGTITAMVSGVKTRAGVLGIDESISRGDFAGTAKASVPTILEQAEDRGLWTGVVTTTTITHATPAGTYAHTPDRDWEVDAKLSAAAREAGFPDIARQLVEFSHGDGIEVALGGGRAFFFPTTTPDPEDAKLTGARTDGRDLVAEWQKRYPGGTYAWKRDQLLAVDASKSPRVLGLFDPSHLKFEADRARDTGGEPSLSEMTTKALDVLERAPKGYFLLVEGGRIDHGHHAGNAYRALGEAIEFSNAVKIARERTNPADTLIVVTADHSHTLTISGYPKRGNPILGLVVGSSGEAAPTNEPAKDQSGHPYTTLGYANGPGYPGASDAQPEGPKKLPHFSKSSKGPPESRPALTNAITEDPLYLQESTLPLGSETHAGEDVPIYAGGPSAALFHGAREQNFVYHVIAAALGIATK
jgi:alkaline phosphatase